VISTAGNLVFTDSWGDSSRGAVASLRRVLPLRRNGLRVQRDDRCRPAVTWQAPDYINDSPMTYEVGGKQYVAIYHLMPVQGSPGFTGSRDELTVFTLPPARPKNAPGIHRSVRVDPTPGVTRTGRGPFERRDRT